MTFREEQLGGGTSLATAERGGGGVAWALLGTAAVIGVGVGLWLVIRDDERPASVEPADPTEAVDVGGVEEDDEAVEDDEATPGVAPAREPRRDAIRTLEESLRVERLWSKVRADGDTVTVESSLCDDPAMSPTIASVIGDLQTAGVARVQCIAPHGAVVFHRDL